MNQISKVSLMIAGLLVAGFFAQAQIGGGGITGGGGGPAVTTGTFQITYPIACSTTPTQDWAYIKTGNVITVYPTNLVSCTSDSISFNTTGGTTLPAAAIPVQEAVFPTSAADNGVNIGATIRFGTNGSVFIGASIFNYNTTWTGSGVKEFPATNLGFSAFTYRTAP